MFGHVKTLGKTNCLFLLLAIASSNIQAVPVVEWDTVGGDFAGHTFSFGTSHQSGDAGIEGLLTYDLGGSWARLDANTGTLGISHQWFEVTYGELIDAGVADSSDPFAITEIGHVPEYYGIQLNWNQPFYIGFQLGGDVVSDPQFGWMQLLYDGSEVQIVSSATERTGLGIYAGTGMAIPEPTTLSLLGMGAAVLTWRRRRPR